MHASRSEGPRPRWAGRLRGYTLIELIMVVVILGTLAVVALPRLNTGDFRGLQFRDQVSAALRFAQKTAVSRRRLVCVTFTPSSVSLSIALSSPAVSCSTALTLPGSTSNVLQSSDASAVFSPQPADLLFLPDGSSSNRSIVVTGQTPITVVGATGSVL